MKVVFSLCLCTWGFLDQMELFYGDKLQQGISEKTHANIVFNYNLVI